jgi:energy-coupling factor transport system substrate-specific component
MTTIVAAVSGLRRLRQPMRFLLAGGLAAAINWLVRFPLSLFMPYLMAVIAATVIGMAFGFIIYSLYVFPGSARAPLAQLRDFVAVNLFSMAVVAGTAGLLNQAIFPLIAFAFAPEAVAHALGIAAGAVTNFIGHRTLTFARA